MRTITTEKELEHVVGGETAIVFKHSPRCPVSRMAHHEMERYCASEMCVPVYVVNVIGAKGLSEHIAENTGIKHESPQAILYTDGKPAWHASHQAITAETVMAAVRKYSTHRRG